MKLACNIDKRGRILRLVGGIVVDGCGVVLIIAGVLSGVVGLMAGGILLSAGGSFMIFEGARGWCALRAMGIKTPM